MRTTPYLDDLDVDPETKRVLSVALEMTRVSLGLTDSSSPSALSNLPRADERNPDLLCEGAVEKLRGHLYGD
jgi:hypothetical protein